MNYLSLLKNLINNPKLNKKAILHYLALLYLVINKPYKSNAYLATEITSKELKKINLFVGGISSVNRTLINEGLIKKMQGQSLSVYILGEKHKIKTKAGEMLANVWYFEKSSNNKIVHRAKERKSKEKTYNKEIEETLSFYWSLYKNKYGVTPVVNIPKVRSQLKNVLKQMRFIVFKSCIPIFMELEDDYLINHKYPIHLISYRIDTCRDKLNDQIIYYGMEERKDEFYKKYINKVIEDNNLSNHKEWLKKKNGGLLSK